MTEICKTFASYTTRTFVGSGSKQRTRSPSLNLEHTAHSDFRCFGTLSASFVPITVVDDVVLAIALVIAALVSLVDAFVVDTPNPDVLGLLQVELRLDDTILMQRNSYGH